jgi:hypothetical protein
VVNHYVRPALRIREYRDTNGDRIPYGERWPDLPPDDAYSVVSNPDRYEPLHIVARALEAWLLDNYLAQPAAPSEPPGPPRLPESVVTEVALAPAEPNQAVLTFTLTSFPGVTLRAGVHYGAAFPSCGCDACDEDVLGQIEELEETVFAIVEGRFTERESATETGYSLEGETWSRSGSTPRTPSDPVLQAPPPTWRAWTNR